MDLCKRDDLKFDYINASLEEKNMMLFKQHLIECENCRSEMEELPDIIESLKMINKPEVNTILVSETKEKFSNINKKKTIKNLFILLISKSKKIKIFTYAITALLFLILSGSIFFFSNSNSIKELLNNLYGSKMASELELLNNIYHGLGQLVGISLSITVFLSLLLMPSIIENIYILYIGKKKNLKFFYT